MNSVPIIISGDADDEDDVVFNAYHLFGSDFDTDGDDDIGIYHSSGRYGFSFLVNDGK